ncbi:hypothetical protein DM01DRAFT_1380740 [Hesseltinella vesiculosa]|uniref:DNA polymerase n=1 Tax=Hesseltinella vesiculosa TaxID=101127 RepID=A0A1X2GTQ6_9FUNG|nr:hypothetical protein DM01DRAFT_1380740 [Hesseltinella vesiculosa]
MPRGRGLQQVRSSKRRRIRHGKKHWKYTSNAAANSLESIKTESVHSSSSLIHSVLDDACSTDPSDASTPLSFSSSHSPEVTAHPPSASPHPARVASFSSQAFSDILTAILDSSPSDPLQHVQRSYRTEEPVDTIFQQPPLSPAQPSLHTVQPSPPSAPHSPILIDSDSDSPSAASNLEPSTAPKVKDEWITIDDSDDDLVVPLASTVPAKRRLSVSPAQPPAPHSHHDRPPGEMPAPPTVPADILPQQEPIPQTPLRDWQTAFDQAMHQLKTNTYTLPPVSVPLQNDQTRVLNQNGDLAFWWFDAQECVDRGIVYLTGKVLDPQTSTYKSCSVAVKNILRTVYVLPRKTMLDDEHDQPSQARTVTHDIVLEEFSRAMVKNNITSASQYKAQRKKYAFELQDIPPEADYLQVRYPYSDPALPQGINGLSFQHVFGTTTGPLEQLLLERNIMGPSWLHIRQPRAIIKEDEKASWCAFEFEVPTMANVTTTEPSISSQSQPQSASLTEPEPSLCVLSLHLHTILNENTNKNEIIAAGVFVQPTVDVDKADQVDAEKSARFTVMRTWDEQRPWPEDMARELRSIDQEGLPVRLMFDEFALLNYLTAQIQRYDPDVIVGHDFSGFTLDILLRRMKDLQVPFWDKIGRLRRKSMPKLQFGPGGTGISSIKVKRVLGGRLLCDTLGAVKNLLQVKSYDLSSLAATELGIVRHDVTLDHTRQLYDRGAKGILTLAKHCWMGAYLAMGLLHKIQALPLSKRMTNIAGNLWSITLHGARSNNVELLLLHEFHRRGYICPDRVPYQWKQVTLDNLEGREKTALLRSVPCYSLPTLLGSSIILENDDSEDKAMKVTVQLPMDGQEKQPTGGLVLEPKTGLHDQFVILLDFNSLYPTIIQEYNICFTTVQRPPPLTADDDTQLRIPDAPDTCLATGLLPSLVRRFVKERGVVKSLMKQPGLDRYHHNQYDIQQRALKLMANSMYGCLGFEQSRFAAKPLALLITSLGRTILQDTVYVAKDLGMDVIYGDTDSVMVATYETDLTKAIAIGQRLQEAVNKRYSLLELGIDGYFKHLLILTKKKYAALAVHKKGAGWTSSIEVKGLDMVRRDWCALSRNTSMAVLEVILSDHDKKLERIRPILQDTAAKVRALGSQPQDVSDFIIFKQLTRRPEDYTNAKSHAHVQVALKMREAGKIIKQGDMVPFVIGKTSVEEHAALADKAFIPETVEQRTCELDLDWYLERQVLPPVVRLCEQLMDTSDFSVMLGLASRAMKSQQRSKPQPKNRLASEEHVEFKLLERPKPETWCLRCPACSHTFAMDNFARCTRGRWVVGFACSQCSKTLTRGSVACQLQLAIRHFVRQYYHSAWVCNNLDCDYRSAIFNLQDDHTQHCQGRIQREYNEEMLYAQLVYFKQMFDAGIGNDTFADSLHTSNGDTDNLPASDQSVIGDSDRKALQQQHGATYKALKEIVQSHLQICGYRYLDMIPLRDGIEASPK